MVSQEAQGEMWLKQRAVEASADDTILTKAYDLTFGYPDPQDIGDRVLHNQFTATWHGQDARLSPGVTSCKPK